MRLLLDECVNEKFRREIVGHDVFTVGYLRWKGLENGRLLATATGAEFVGMITTDLGIEHQQNLRQPPLSIYVLHAASNDLPDLAKPTANLLAALSSPPATPQVVHIWP